MSVFTKHAADVLQIIGGAVSVATLIVKLTPTDKDDLLLGKLIKVLSAFSLCNADGSFIGSREEK